MAWQGTDDDTARAPSNTVTLEAADAAVLVTYAQRCFGLDLSHTGSGTDPSTTRAGAGEAWQMVVIADPGPVFWESAEVGDFDIDGDLDLVAYEDSFETINWWENPGDGGSDWVEHLASSGDHIREIEVADVDADGDPDLVTVEFNSNDVTWWENRSRGQQWVEHLVDGRFENPSGIRIGDLDGDGRLDLVSASFDEDLSWWKNRDGGGQFWLSAKIPTDDIAFGPVSLGDIDGDGDLDVVSPTTSVIQWFENADGKATTWNSHPIGGDEFSALFELGDIDGDGDLDVVQYRAFAFTRWFENVAGDGTVWTERTITENEFNAHDLSVADPDGDGDLDVLASTGSSGILVWWQNVDGAGLEWRQHSVSNHDLSSEAHAPGDFDGDGDLDVAAVRNSSPNIVLFENLDLGLCPAASWEAGDELRLIAAPADGWGVTGWTGTDDDDLVGFVNTLTMPAEDAAAGVDYTEGCFPLTRSHTGEGIDPLTGPASSPGCAVGEYTAGTPIAVFAQPDIGWSIETWSGTDDDTSVAVTNTVTMPGRRRNRSGRLLAELLYVDASRRRRGRRPDRLTDQLAGLPDRHLPQRRVDRSRRRPGPGLQVAGWRNTLDDKSTEETNALQMPPGDWNAGVFYEPVP